MLAAPQSCCGSSSSTRSSTIRRSSLRLAPRIAGNIQCRGSRYVLQHLLHVAPSHFVGSEQSMRQIFHMPQACLVCLQ